MKRSILWFKTDLRLHDNETLVKALAKSDVVVPVYCFDDSHFTDSEFGFKKTGAFRAKFLLESLQNLDDNLRKIGSGLLILRGKPEIELPKIASEYACSKVFSKKEVGTEEKNTEKLVQEALWKQKCELETFSTSTLYHASDLPFSIKDIPDVFTVFRKKVEKESTIRVIFESPKFITSPHFPKINLPSLESLGLNEIKLDKRSVLEFKGGEEQAIKRLHYYFQETKLILNYKNTRNELIGGDYSSKFSPYLAFGCISPRKIYHELKIFEENNVANESTYWLVFELLWRDYFRFMMKKHQNKFFLSNGLKTGQTTNSKIDQKKIQQWINGETGIDFIDANMLELKLTGFMSNRGRQNVASYFCHDLNLDWRYGAAYFEQQLIDYDVCSNWGNWAYLAGVGNDPREKRIFNIEKQSKDYDPEFSYRKLWLVEKK
jgi:deoxyribodipyrimidine photo-lyase